MMYDKQDVLDAMATLSFLIGIANYNENITQSNLQDSAKQIMDEIHGHLREQDEKIDHILELLERRERNE